MPFGGIFAREQWVACQRLACFMTVRAVHRESRQNNAFCEKVVDKCAEFLSDISLENVDDDRIDAAYSLLGKIYVPNKKDGVYDISQGSNKWEGIPFIPVVPHETVKVHCDVEHIVHPKQWEGIYSNIAAIDYEGLPEDMYDQAKKWVFDGYNAIRPEGVFEMPAITGSTWWGYVWSPSSMINLSFSPDSKEDHGVDTRPIFMANLETLGKDEGSGFYHELVHVVQMLRGYVYRMQKRHKTNLDLRSELEAYSAQAIAEEAYYNVSIDENPFGWNSLAIESVRRRINANHEDPYRVNKKLLKGVEAIGARLH